MSLVRLPIGQSNLYGSYMLIQCPKDKSKVETGGIDTNAFIARGLGLRVQRKHDPKAQSNAGGAQASGSIWKPLDWKKAHIR